jgi:putative ABC transport system permease protein
VATALAGGPYSVASIVSRNQLAASLQADPIGLGVIGALGLGALAAVVIAGIGFLVTVAFLARERVGELALLRAVGESARGVAAMLALEQILLLVYGLVAGCALGLLLGWLSIPFASLTSTGASAMPPPVTIVPWQAIAVFAIPIAAALALGASIVIQLTSGGPIAAALRGRDDVA